MFKIMDSTYDEVIKSKYLITKVNYKFILDNIIPLINKFDQQRNVLPSNIYKRLERDIKLGCVLPALTLAIIDDNISENPDEEYIRNIVKNGFILDGIQRLNIIHKIYNENPQDLQIEKVVYINIIVSDSIDKLLYRMVTLNNGQKPMSARHQIEILTQNMYDFDSIPLDVITEKEGKYKRNIDMFEKADIVKAYLAFATSSTNIENQKIIESKMDELITNKIINSKITERNYEFMDVTNLIYDLIRDDVNLKKWFKNSNNLIGFSSGVSKNNSYMDIKNNKLDFKNLINNTENAINGLNVSKVKLGKIRRECIEFITENYKDCINLDEFDLLDEFSKLN